MLKDALQFVIETLFNLLLFAFLLRFYLQLMRAPFRHPFSQFIVAVTDFAVRPTRRLIPGWHGLDIASLFMAWFTQCWMLAAVLWLNGFPFLVAQASAYVGIALLAGVLILKSSVYILMIVVVIQAILSWVNPYNPLSPILESLSFPFVRAVRSVIPPIANVDLSPLIIFFVCQLIIMVPIAWLERLVRALF
jgi:YggT family protein